MPNLRGGKAYKKTKGYEDEVQFLKKEPDQFIGRVIRNLGDLNMSVFCEDNKTRVCKIASGIKKSTRIYVDDIVLISLRDCLMSKADLDKGLRSDRGDIVGKYTVDQHAELKETVNKHIFVQTQTLRSMADKFAAGDDKGAEDLANAAVGSDIFDMEGSEEEEEVKTKQVAWKMERGAMNRVAVSEKDHLDNKDIDAI
jgi:initiation factor 1A